MNNTRESTPPKPNVDLPNPSTDLNKTLGILGTPHEESIAKFNPRKLVQKGGIEEIPPRTPQTLEPGKPQNQAPLLMDLGGESNPQEQSPKNNPKKSP
jgi:hypothetical protein